MNSTMKAEVGDGWIAVPFMSRKVAKGKVKVFAFRAAFDEVTQTISAADVALLTVADKKTGEVESLTPVTEVVGGRPKLKKSDLKAMRFGIAGAAGFAEADGRSLTLRSTGRLRGSLTWKADKAKGNVWGVDIDGVLYGSVYFKKTGEAKPLAVSSAE